MPSGEDAPDVIGLLQHWAHKQPDTVALRFGEQEWTWAQLLDRVRRLAAVLTRSGMGPKDRVAFLDKNHPAAVELVLAAAWIGAVTVTVNFRLAPAEIAYVLKDAEAKLVIAGPEFETVLAALDNPPQMLALGKDYEHLLETTSPSEHRRTPTPDDCLLQLYTSGTTGFPKGAMLTHRNLTAHSAALSSRIGLTRDSVNLAPMPLYHVGGMAWALQSLHRGATLILVRDVVPAELVDIAERHRVTHTFVVPAVLAGILQVPDLAARNLTSLRGLTYGAAPMPLPLLARVLASIDAGIFQVYGATEVSGAATALSAEDHRNPVKQQHLGSAGLPLPGIEVAIVDPDTGKHLPTGEVGEIQLRGEQVMSGYWHQPEATQAALLPEGWLRTGDAGYRDEHGYLFVVDRIGDLIISGGENIYPAELERVLSNHPAVAEVAVIGVPHDKWGEVPKAVIVPAGPTHPDPAELLTACRAQLASYKLPKLVEFVPELPRNATGKILKRNLRSQNRRQDQA